MKITEVHRTANVAWSPVNHNTAMLATGTAAHQTDATFSTSANIEIFEVSPSAGHVEPPLRGSVPCDQRIYKLAWTPQSSVYNTTTNAGALIAGVENGIVMYSVDGILNKSENPVISRSEKHTGAVHALDVSPLVSNLLVTGASESEVLVWDLNIPNHSAAAGPKSYPLDDVSCVSWNRRINYIFASCLSSRCILWDLRRHDSIIKLGDQNSRMRYKAVDWNPEIATQLALASEDDHTPVIQLWDLRNASSAVKTLEGHLRGILSIAWCPHDPDILLSAGKDGCVYGWNVNEAAKGEIIFLLPQSKQWPFEVSWCPRIPSLFSASSYENTIAIYTVMGGHNEPAAVTTTPSSLADAFPGMDLNSVHDFGLKKDTTLCESIRKAPKWLRRPGGLAFSIDGKLIRTFPQDGVVGLELSQVILDQAFVKEATLLEQFLRQSYDGEFCEAKIAAAKSHHEKEEWNFIKAYFESDYLPSFLRLLGYDNSADSFEPVISTENGETGSPARNDLPAAVVKSSVSAAVRLGSSFRIPNGRDLDGTISRALLVGNLEKAVQLCVEHGREAEAIMLSLYGMTSSLPELFHKTQEKYFQSHGSDLSSLIYAIVKNNPQLLLEKCRLDSWREVLAVLINYAPRDELPTLIQQLGLRLETELSGVMSNSSIICYICAGNIDKAVDLWAKRHTKSYGTTADLLQLTLEKILFLNRGIQVSSRRPAVLGPKASRILEDYALYLASQGQLGMALRFANIDSSSALLAVKHTLYMALGAKAAAVQANMRQAPMSSVKATPLRRVVRNDGHAPVYQPGIFHPAVQTVPHVPSWQPGSYNPGIPKSKPPGPVSAYGRSTPTPPVSGDMYGVPPSPLKAADPSWNMYDHRTNFPQMPSSVPSFAPPQFPGVPAPGPALRCSQPPSIPSAPAVGSPPSGYFDPSAYSAHNQENVQPASLEARLSSYQHIKLAGGWNDPPPLTLSSSRRQSNPTPAPILCPLPQAQNSYPDMAHGAALMGNSIAAPQMMNLPPFQAPPVAQPFSAAFDPGHADAAVPEEPKKKDPIPLEHVKVCDEFSRVITSTRQNALASGDSHSVRKLDDIAKKLEILNDCLRRGSLSPVTLSGLHQIVDCLQIGDVMQALNIHTHLATQSSFVESGSFLPAVKVLLQLTQRFPLY